MTLIQAIQKADRLAAKYERDYVVVEAIEGEFEVCSEGDLDAYFCGVSQSALKYWTGGSLND